jgi:hypothetical protein
MAADFSIIYDFKALPKKQKSGRVSVPLKIVIRGSISIPE